MLVRTQGGSPLVLSGKKLRVGALFGKAEGDLCEFGGLPRLPRYE